LFVNAAHSFDFGAGTLLYHLHPGLMEPDGPTSQIRRDEVEGEQALESGVYVTHRFTASSRFSIVSGFRYSYYNYLGPHQVFLYAANSPMSETSIIDTVSYKKGKSIKNYGNPEFRISARFALTPGFSVKASYNTMSQYIHMLSNTTAISPTDVWKLSDPNIKPQTGDQLSLGFYKNLKSNTIETSVELYYKRIKNYLDYKPGATLVLNHHIETEVIETRGKAYGIEVLVKKPGGKLNGWISYTYSRILLQANDPTLGQFVNFGQYYPANYDKPHDATMAGNFRVNHRFSISMNTTYSTGRPITLPVGRFFYAGSQRVLYSERNKYRIPDYFRADFSMNVQGNHKVKQRTHNSWTIGIYNLTGRKNAYSVYYTSENGRVNGYRLSIFGSAIPFVNFNIRF
ncbi:MAG: TonB-dependent receptor plug domain-containing protein, partial [Flavisolibacter sp.]